MDIPSNPSPVDPSPVLRADRDAFLDDVLRLEGRKRRDQFAVVINDLIAWSECQKNALVFVPRAIRDKYFVTYNLVRNPPHTFWQAYPHEKDGARFYVTGYKLLTPNENQVLYDGFAELSFGGKPKTPDVPAMAFGDLILESTRQKVKRLLGQALASLGMSVESQ